MFGLLGMYSYQWSPPRGAEVCLSAHSECPPARLPSPSGSASCRVKSSATFCRSPRWTRSEAWGKQTEVRKAHHSAAVRGNKRRLGSTWWSWSEEACKRTAVTAVSRQVACKKWARPLPHGLRASSHSAKTDTPLRLDSWPPASHPHMRTPETTVGHEETVLRSMMSPGHHHREPDQSLLHLKVIWVEVTLHVLDVRGRTVGNEKQQN